MCINWCTQVFKCTTMVQIAAIPVPNGFCNKDKDSITAQQQHSQGIITRGSLACPQALTDVWAGKERRQPGKHCM